MNSSSFIRRLFISQYGLIILSAVFLSLFYNATFFQQLLHYFPIEAGYSTFFVSVFGILCLFQIALFTLFTSHYWIKGLLISTFVIAAISSYFMGTYGIVIDHEMLNNAFTTNQEEALGLINFPFFMHVFFLAGIPAFLIIKWPIQKLPLLMDLKLRILILIVSVAASLSMMLLSSADYTAFFREYKIIRYHANPLYPIYSTSKLITHYIADNRRQDPIQAVSTDANIHEGNGEKRELIIFVLGETARADHFQLNGYQKETNPNLSKIDNVVSYQHVSSCGTSTGISVPCLYSPVSRQEYQSNSIKTHENALDVLARLGVNILWRDNNSSSKGVAERVAYQNFRSPNLNPECKPECRDIGMLSNLEQYIESKEEGDILIVLHQMGSHGPEYFKRYPKSFEHFSPTCKNNKLGKCTQQEIMNAYDNTIRYTDYFLSEVIHLLKKYDASFETAMLYVSDHGESLGENGVYLHGLPYRFAPDSQKQVPLIMWTGQHFDFPTQSLLQQQNRPYSHDDVFCNLLTIFEVQTKDCIGKPTFFTPQTQTS